MTIYVKDQSGNTGARTVTNTTAQTGYFTSITILEDANFSAFTEENATGTMTGFTVPAGVTLFGVITAFTLASGKVRAYS